METFEPGIQCPWTGVRFQQGQYGMKCCNANCLVVMTPDAWNEKQYCRACGYTQAVLATASTSPALTSNLMKSYPPIDGSFQYPNPLTTNSRQNGQFKAELTVILIGIILLGFTFFTPHLIHMIWPFIMSWMSNRSDVPGIGNWSYDDLFFSGIILGPVIPSLLGIAWLLFMLLSALFGDAISSEYTSTYGAGFLASFLGFSLTWGIRFWAILPISIVRFAYVNLVNNLMNSGFSFTRGLAEKLTNSVFLACLVILCIQLAVSR